MVNSQNRLWAEFLDPIVGVLIDRHKLHQQHQSINWEEQSDRIRNPDLTYPSYYQHPNNHSRDTGYLNSQAAILYDAITPYLLPPNERWIRQEFINHIQGTPQRILDLGCGTGATTLMLKQAFPQAQVMGLDLSPYMLVIANRKAEAMGIEMQWRHGKAEDTGLPNASFDLITASLLFHETPPAVARAILRESFRLLKPGKQILILDGNTQTLGQVNWLTEVFAAPDMTAYPTDCVDTWMGLSGFETVQTQGLWWLHQVTLGMKPLPIAKQVYQSIQHLGDNLGSPGILAPA